jgi:hypothetical protein
MEVASARLGRYQLQPTGTNQAIEQAACLLGIKPAAKSILPDVL